MSILDNTISSRFGSKKLRWQIILSQHFHTFLSLAYWHPLHTHIYILFQLWYSEQNIICTEFYDRLQNIPHSGLEDNHLSCWCNVSPRQWCHCVFDGIWVSAAYVIVPTPCTISFMRPLPLGSRFVFLRNQHPLVFVTMLALKTALWYIIPRWIMWWRIMVAALF